MSCNPILDLYMRDGVLSAEMLREFAAGCAYRALERYGAELTAARLNACLWACDVAVAMAAGADISDGTREAAEKAAHAAGEAVAISWAASRIAGDAAWAAEAASWSVATDADAAANASWAAARASGPAAFASEDEAQHRYLLELLAAKSKPEQEGKP